MDFNKYQETIDQFAVYPEAGSGRVEALSYCGLGLGGETGEVLEHLKRIARDNDGVITGERREAVFKELGDCCWYLSRLCSEFGFDFSNVAEANIAKLMDRLERNVIHGDGDNR